MSYEFFSIWWRPEDGPRWVRAKKAPLAWDLDGRKETEVGYVLAKAYWARGLATEAARAIREYGFEKLGFDRLVSVIQPANLASQNVARKNGMRCEKRLEHKGIAIDVYVIDREDARPIG